MTGGGTQCRALGDNVAVWSKVELDPEGLFQPL